MYLFNATCTNNSGGWTAWYASAICVYDGGTLNVGVMSNNQLIVTGTGSYIQGRMPVGTGTVTFTGQLIRLI